jgi:hypothetical protein
LIRRVYDAGKKIKGKKRHILVDTTGLLMHGVVHAADIQDRDGGGLVMATLFGLYPFLLKLFADGGYQDPSVSKRRPWGHRQTGCRNRQTVRSGQGIRRTPQATGR